jgi:hypothetical protein
MSTSVGELSSDLDAVRHALEGAPVPAPPPTANLDRLVRLFGLSEFERSTLILCAGVELDPEIARLCAERGGPTFGLALRALPGSHWSAILPDAPLRRWRLVRLDPSVASLAATPIRIDERILHAVLGIDAREEELDGLLSVVVADDGLTRTHERLADAVADVVTTERARGRWPAMQLSGADASTRRAVAARAASRCGLRLFALDAGAAPLGRHEGAVLARLCSREAAVAGAVLLIELDHLDSDPERRLATVRFAEQMQGALVLGGDAPLAGFEHGFRFDIRRPSENERRELWRSLLGDVGGWLSLNGALDVVVGQFELSPPAIRAAAREAEAIADEPLSERLWDACRRHARPSLDDLAQRIDPDAGWADLVLAPPQLAMLRQVAAQVRWRTRVYDDWGFAAGGGRGRGISALFAGPSGTGKTMAAEVLARELRLDLFRIDLSAVVSKYIGETEKNLRRVFAAAERGGAVLLFDEADALFGRRTEVRDSHDRFANIEISYLLQRMEAYRGLAILTTNQRRAIDDAFLRRLRFVVEFPFPGSSERASIWRRVLAGVVPTEALDHERLAQLAIAGASIRNVALGAAFLAADEGTPLRMDHILRAARSEYAKLERSLTQAELDGWGDVEEGPS